MSVNIFFDAIKFSFLIHFSLKELEEEDFSIFLNEIRDRSDDEIIKILISFICPDP